MNTDIVSGLKKRYASLPPLIISRSIERARNEAELFDILDTVPSELPISWDMNRRRWAAASLLYDPRSKEA